MTTKYEYAKEQALHIEEKKAQQGLHVYSGRMIVIGVDRENFGNELDPQTYREVVMEYIRPVALFFSLPGMSKLVPILTQKMRLSNPALGFSDMARIEIKANTKAFKNRSDVTVFDKNGPVQKPKR